MTRNLKSLLLAISFLLILAGCQTTTTANMGKTAVPCSSHSYDFLHVYNQDSECLTFSYPQNATVERTSNFSNGHAVVVDLIEYNSNEFYRNTEKKFLNANIFDFEGQVTGSAKNISNNKQAKQFLTNMKFKFLDSDDAKKLAVWTAKSYAIGKTYHGYSFVKLFTRANRKYQFVGFYMENSNTPMRREDFKIALNRLSFRSEINSEKTTSDSAEERLLKIKRLLENGLITESEATEKRKKILKSL